MKVRLLGTAAGGGFPQWNCWCPVCRVAREAPARAKRRTQSSIAVSADGVEWFLFNASPDVREQVNGLAHDPWPAIRDTPVQGIILTDAELDHTLGLSLLREARRLSVYCTAAAHHILERDSALLPITRAFADVTVTELVSDTVCPLTVDAVPSGLTVEPFFVTGSAPRFASTEEPGHTIGVMIRGGEGSCVAYVPGCAQLDDALLARLAGVSLIIVDGTFWSSDELVRLGVSDRTAEAMGHLPIAGPSGTLARFLQVGCASRVVYTHLNNSNPVLIEESAERRRVHEAGCIVGEDGMEFRIGPDGRVALHAAG